MEMIFRQVRYPAFVVPRMRDEEDQTQETARVVIDDDKLVAEAVRLGGHRTKREAVEQALGEFILRRKRDRKFYRLLSD